MRRIHMNYESIILELLDRIKVLEIKVAELEKNGQDTPTIHHKATNKIMKSYTQQARDYINERKAEARQNGLSEIVLVCNDIQQALGLINRAPLVCNAMYQCMKDGDEILHPTPSGKSTTIKIKYYV